MTNNAPRAGTTGTYKSPSKGLVKFKVLRTEGNLCYALYDGDTECHGPFIWRFHDGLNTLHDWPGKSSKVAP